MEEGDNVQAMKCFEDAIKINENDPDVYYHRGQGVLVSSLIMVDVDSFPSVLHYQRLCLCCNQLYEVVCAGSDIRVLAHSACRRTIQIGQPGEQHGNLPTDNDVVPLKG